jgi:hypothetical protein
MDESGLLIGAIRRDPSQTDNSDAARFAIMPCISREEKTRPEKRLLQQSSGLA